MANRVINFFDQAASSTAPTIGNVTASDLVKYPDDATFEANELGAPVGGNIYYNTTSDTVRLYSDSLGMWITILTDNVVDNTFTIQDNADPTKKMRFEVSSVGTGITRVFTVPNADTTLVGIDVDQVLTNKTIDADNNIITNLEHGAEVDNPSSGVHGVTGDVVGTTDTQDLSNKTFIDPLIVSDTTQSTDKDTGAVVVEGGVGIEKNLNVGGDVVVEGDLTVQGTTVTLNTVDLDVEDRNITVNKNGNQATADDQAGLTVEMTDAPDAKVLYDKDLASKWKVGDDVTQHEVITSDHQQTIKKKDIDLETAANNQGIAVSKDTTANLEALARKAARIYFSTDDEQFLGDDGTQLGPFGSGSGSGGLNFYTKGDSEQAKLADFLTGQNATFLGGGTLGGVFSISTTSTDLIRGKKTFKYVQNATGANSTNDYIASQLISIPQGYRGRSMLAKFRYRTDATSANIKPIVWDVTNSQQLNLSTDTLDQFIDATDKTSAEFQTIFTVPSNCAELRFGIQVITGESNSVTTWDDVVITPELASSIQGLLKEQSSELQQTVTFGTVVITGALTAQSGNGLYSYNSGNGIYTALVSCTVAISASFFRSGSSTTEPTIYKNGVVVSRAIETGAGSARTCASADIHVVAGDTFEVRNTTGGTTQQHITITAVGSSTHVVTPARSNMTDWASYTPTFTGFGTVSVFDFKWRRVGDTLQIQGQLTAGTTTAVEARVSFPTGLVTPSTTPALQVSGFYIKGTGAAINDKGGALFVETSLGYFTFGAIGTFGAGGTATVNPLTKQTGTGLGASGNTFQVNISLPINGWKSDALFLAAIPIEETVYLKDIKAANTAGGTATSGSFATRVLNTKEGSYAWCTTPTTGPFTLQPGRYRVNFNVPAYAVLRHKAKLRNTTDSTDVIIGESTYSGDTLPSIQSNSRIIGEFTITTAKTFEIQHRVEQTKTTNGFGVESNFGVSELYTNGSITKLPDL